MMAPPTQHPTRAMRYRSSAVVTPIAPLRMPGTIGADTIMLAAITRSGRRILIIPGVLS